MRVVIAEDSGLVRQGVARLLEAHGFDVVGEVDNPKDLLRRVVALEPDAAIVDIRMPPTHTDEGLVAAERIRAAHPDVGVLVLSQHVDAVFALRLIRDGTGRVGYLLKDRVLDGAELAESLVRIVAGETVIDRQLVSDLMTSSGTHRALALLTARELQVLGLLAEGRSDRGIADQLYISLKTVETHVRHILTKLDLPASVEDNRRVLAVLTFLRS